MEIFIKFIDGDTFNIDDVFNYQISDGYWKIITKDGRSFFFNKEEIKYIGDKSIRFY